MRSPGLISRPTALLVADLPAHDVSRGAKSTLSGRTEDGLRFTAEHGYPVSVRNADTLTLMGVHCTLLSEAQPARLWVGEIACRLPATTDNLVISVTRNDRSRTLNAGLRLQGSKYLYFIVPRGEGARAGLLLDLADDSAPDFSILDADLRSMEVALAQPVHIDILYAYDDAEKLLGCSDAELRRKSLNHDHREVSPDAPVPTFLSRIAWVAPLFTSLSQAFGHHDAARLKGAMLSYVESFRDSTIEERYIWLHVAIGALAHAVLEEQHPDGLRLVRDENGWRDWLVAQRDALAENAMPQAADDLLANLTRAGRPDPGLLVRRALRHLGLPILPELETELNLRDQVLATGSMPSYPENDVEPLVRQIQILRVTLFAMLAKWVGYDGEIKGWKRDRSNHYEPADWWVANPETRRSVWKRFLVEVTDATLDLWPDFTKPEVPKEGPLAAVARFADSLANKTDGKVIATLQPVPQSSGDRLFEFKIMVAGNVGTQVTFFSASEASDGEVRILGWEGEQVLGRDGAQVTSFLKQVAESGEMRETVERMLILADELGRGER
jgi:hypothetical protein